MTPDADRSPPAPAAPPPPGRHGGVGSRRRALLRVAGCLAIAASLGLHFVVMLLYSFQWDRAAAATILPFWAWAGAGLGLAGIGAALLRHRLAVVPAGIWILSVAICSDETRGIVRAVFAPPAASASTFPLPLPDGPDPTDAPETTAPSADRPTGFRVVSLNCRRRPDAAAAVEALRPDVVLFQEAPHFRFVHDMSRRLHGPEGSFIYGVDTAVVARGRLRVTAPGRRGTWGQVTLTMPGHRPLEILNVHLIRPVVRLDLWSRSTWRAHFYNRRARDLQLRELVGRLLSTAGNRPAIVAGDFNAPPSDPVFHRLAEHFVDTYAVAGVGWCNNRALDGAAAFPVTRTDQIWVTREFRTLRHHVADPGVSVNHRMVVVDLALENDLDPAAPPSP